MYVVYWRGEELCRLETADGVLSYFEGIVDPVSRTIVLF